jgi:hypothetical protein
MARRAGCVEDSHGRPRTGRTESRTRIWRVLDTSRRSNQRRVTKEKGIHRMKLIPIMKRLIPVLMVISITMCIVSCEDDNTDWLVKITPHRFYLKRDVISYSYNDTHEWDTTLTQARVHFRVQNLVSGGVWIRVRDGDGREIFFLLITHDHDIVDDNDLEYTDTTLVGKPGVWRIELEYEDFTGGVRLTMN